MDSVADIDNMINRLLSERESLKARNKKIAARLKALRVARNRMADSFDAIREAQERAEADLLADFIASAPDD